MNYTKISCVCVDNTDVVRYLTVGKIYDVCWPDHIPLSTTDFQSIYCRVFDDTGGSDAYRFSRFITLEKWREQKLVELGIN